MPDRIPGMEAQPTNRGGPLYWLTRRSRKFWIAAISLPILYVASFGPACWVTSRLTESSRALSVIYRPILMPLSGGRMRETRQLKDRKSAYEARASYSQYLPDSPMTRYAELFGQGKHWLYTVAYRASPLGNVVVHEGWYWGRPGSEECHWDGDRFVFGPKP